MAEQPVERKSYSFKAGLTGNVISGGPAAIGNMDQGDDVIFPGSFKGVLTDFLVNGWVAKQHEWDELPIAYPTVAKEQGNILYSEATFHSHQAAQDARTVASERLSAGKNVGLSIGFQVADDGDHYFESGDMLLIWAKEKKYDMSLFDTASILACKDWCRGITQFKRLFEWSIVTSPMNLAAQADSCKRIWTVPGYRETQAISADNAALVATVAAAAKTLLDSKSETGTETEQSARLEKIRTIAALSDAEDILRDAGMSQKERATFISRVKTLQRDAASDDAGTPEPEVKADEAPTDEPATDPEPETPAVEVASETLVPETKTSVEDEAPIVTRRPDPTAPLGLELLTAKREVARILHADYLKLMSRIDRDSRVFGTERT